MKIDGVLYCHTVDIEPTGQSLSFSSKSAGYQNFSFSGVVFSYFVVVEQSSINHVRL